MSLVSMLATHALVCMDVSESKAKVKNNIVVITYLINETFDADFYLLFQSLIVDYQTFRNVSGLVAVDSADHRHPIRRPRSSIWSW